MVRLAALVILFLSSIAQGAPSVPALPPNTTVPAAPPSPETEPSPALELHGYVQSDAILYAQSSEDQLTATTAEPLNQERIFIRRARLQANVRKGPLLGWVEIDGNTVRSPTLGLAAAEIGYLWTRPLPERSDLLHFSTGLLRIPFGSEIQEFDRERLFFERSNISRALFPGTFDLAFRVQARWRSLVLQAAVMNGEPLGSGSLAGRDPTAAKDFVGRIGVALARGPLRVDGGVSVLQGTGFHAGTTATKDVLVWRDQNEDGIVQTSEIQIIPGKPGTPSSSFHRFALGCDLRATVSLPRLGDGALSAETVWAGNLDRGLVPADPVSSGRDIRELGVVLGLTQQIGNHLLAGVRYDWYNADLDASDALPVRVVPVSVVYSTTAFLLGWRWSDLDRVAVELDVNRNPSGRTNAGLPTNLPSNTLTVRAQLAF
jgi:hypothetical protein